MSKGVSKIVKREIRYHCVRFSVQKGISFRKKNVQKESLNWKIKWKVPTMENKLRLKNFRNIFF